MAEYRADIITAFNGGELTPVLAGRIDKDEIKIGSRYLSNFMPQLQGGLKKFYGTTKISAISNTVTDSNFMLVPFDGAGEPVALLFVDDVVYIVTATECYLASFTVTSNQVVGASYLQINDVIYFTNENSGIFEVRYYGIVEGKHIFNYVKTQFKDEPYFPIGWAGNYYGTLTTNGYMGTITITAGATAQTYGLSLPTILADAGSGKNIIFEDGAKKCITLGDANQGGPYAATVGTTTLSIVRVRNGVETTVASATIGNEQQISEA